MLEFSDTTYTSFSTLWIDTHPGMLVDGTVESNNFIMAASSSGKPPRLVKFTYTPTSSTFEESGPITGYIGTNDTRFWALEAI